MKYYNIELLKTEAENLKKFLRNEIIKFEVSKAKNYYHFEILLNNAGVEKVNNFIEAMEV